MAATGRRVAGVGIQVRRQAPYPPAPRATHSWWAEPLTWDAFSRQAEAERPRLKLEGKGMVLGIWISDSVPSPMSRRGRHPDDDEAD